MALKSPESLESIIEVGLDAGAEDFSESDSSEEGQEIEVSTSLPHVDKSLTLYS